MVEEFPIFSLEGDNYAKLDDQVENLQENDEKKEPIIQMHEPTQVLQLEYNEEEMPSISQTIYDIDIDINQIFTQGTTPVPEQSEQQMIAEMEFTIRTLRNRVTAIELQNNQLTQQLDYEKQEREADNVHWEKELITTESKLEEEKSKMQSEIAELTRKHIEELQAKQSLNGKIENIDKIRLERDNLVVEQAKLESKHDKMKEENLNQRNELANARSELSKLKAEVSRFKTDFDTCKNENSEKANEISRLKKESEQGKGSQDLQVKQLTAEKTRLEEQVKALRLEANALTQSSSRLTSDLATAQRTNSTLNADIAQLQQQIARAESIERELHQAKWRISQLETEQRDATGDFTFRLSQAQQQAQQQSHQLQQQVAQSQHQLAQMQQQLSQVQQQLVQTQQQLTQAQQHVRTLSAAQNTTVYQPPPPPAPVVLSTPTPYVPAPYILPPAPVPVPQPRSSSTGRRGAQQSAAPASSTEYKAAYDPSSYHSSFNASSSTVAPSSGSSISSLLFGGGGYASSAAQPTNPYAYTSGTGPVASHSNSTGPVSRRLTSGNNANSGGPIDSTVGAPFGTASKSPFANDVTSAQINHVFDDLDRRLTGMMTEKTTLQEESERLHQRGLKTLKDRSRLQAVEHRLSELVRDIMQTRKELSFKPS